jgi:hypothetical protein
MSLDDLAREQGVQPITSIDDLRGEEIDDFEDFLKAIRSLRE